MKRRKTDLLHRPPFSWRLIIPPLIVIPWAVYLNVIPARVADGVAAIPSVDEVTAKAQSGATPDPVHGIDGKGRHYLIERSPKWPMIEFRMRLKQPNTIVDR